MVMTTVIDVFALLPDLIKCNPRPPIADVCALVVNPLITLIKKKKRKTVACPAVLRLPFYGAGAAVSTLDDG